MFRESADTHSRTSEIAGASMAISNTMATVAAEHRSRARNAGQFGRQSDNPLVPTGTVTLLLADIEGSTRIWEEEPNRMARALATMDRVLADVVRTNNGVCPVAQGEGDSFVVAFTCASDAAACALALQRAALSPIRLRIGLHTGEALLRDRGNYMGPMINRAARLRELAHGGQTLLSGATSDLVHKSLPAQTWLARLGCYVLRDLARPERVAQLCHPDLHNDFPPLRTHLGWMPQCDTRDMEGVE